LPVFLAFPFYFGFVLFQLPLAWVLGVSLRLWVFFFFWGGLIGVLVGFGGFILGLVWVFDWGFICILGFLWVLLGLGRC
jgi:hypothetical protein